MEKLKKAYLEARKNNDKVKKELLSVIIGEIENAGLLKNPLLTDKEKNDLVLDFLNKFQKKLIKAKNEYGSMDSSFLTKTEQEIAIIDEFLPQKLSNEQLEELINELVLNLGFEDLKDIMVYLKENYNGLYDGATAAKLIKEILSK